MHIFKKNTHRVPEDANYDLMVAIDQVDKLKCQYLDAQVPLNKVLWFQTLVLLCQNFFLELLLNGFIYFSSDPARS